MKYYVELEYKVSSEVDFFVVEQLTVPAIAVVR